MEINQKINIIVEIGCGYGTFTIPVSKQVGIIHWRSDINSPRGSSLDIRPTEEQCKTCATGSKFKIKKISIDLEPYHFGIILEK